MKRSLKILISTGFLVTGLLAADGVQAQYKGSYAPQAAEQEDPAAKPIPKIFSSQVSSQQQAERLDIIYENLKISLWMAARTNFIQQKKLYDNIQNEKFKYTRYKAEFQSDLQSAMDTLNESYTSTMKAIDEAKVRYPQIKEGIRTIDYEILDPLWEQEIKAFEEKADTFFQMQNEFLQNYRKLVNFILENSGSYYFDSNTKKLNFYDAGIGGVYIKYVDRIRMISYKQTQLLYTLAPANLEEDPIPDIPLEE